MADGAVLADRRHQRPALKRVLVCGGGNAAHVLVARLTGLQDACGEPKYHVNWLSFSQADNIRDGMGTHGLITVESDDWGIIAGRPVKVSSDPAAVVPGTDVAILLVPAFVHDRYLQVISALVPPERDLVVGALPGEGGFDTAVWKAFLSSVDARHRAAERPNLTVFVGETLPWACRVYQHGKLARVLGRKKDVDVAVTPASRRGPIIAMLQDMIGPLPRLSPASPLACTLSNINSVWHPCIVWGLFKDWDGQTPFDAPPLFYEGVGPWTAALLNAVSNEVLAVKAELLRRHPQLDLAAVRHVEQWMRRAYKGDIADTSTLQSCMNTNKGYEGLVYPMVEVDIGEKEEEDHEDTVGQSQQQRKQQLRPSARKLMPNFRYRYMTEDVPFGLCVTAGIAKLAGVPVPTMLEVIRFGQQRLGKEFVVAAPTTTAAATGGGGGVAAAAAAAAGVAKAGEPEEEHDRELLVLAGRDLGETRAPQRYGFTDLDTYLRAHSYIDADGGGVSSGGGGGRGNACAVLAGADDASGGDTASSSGGGEGRK